ncbi:hypothetical protein KI387_002963, partial [Taxus chinensis]
MELRAGEAGVCEAFQVKGHAIPSAGRAQLPASEVGVFPPLPLGAERCVLVGDPQHQPVTRVSQAAGMLQNGRSPCERSQQA